MKVLVVDDDPSLTLLVTSVVEASGREANVCSDAESAWSAFQQHSFSIAILDWMLPGMSGLELCRKLRAHPRGEQLLILMLTARDSADDLQEVLNAGADDYLSKPFDTKVLAVRLAIAERRAKERIRRLLADAALEASDLRFRSLCRSAPVGIFLTDADSHCVYANDQLLEMTGSAGADPLAADWKSVVHPDDRARAAEVVNHSRDITAPRAESFRLNTRSGIRWVHASCVPLRFNDGRYAGGIGIVEDQTESSLSREALLEKNLLLESMLASLDDGVIVADLAGRIAMVNPATSRILQLDAGHCPLTDCSLDDWPFEYGIYRPDSQTIHPADDLPIARSLRGESVEDARLFVRHRGIPRGIWLSANARPMRDDAGVSHGAVMVLRDITESVRVRRLQNAVHESELANRAQSVFLANISHELRTPINAILGFVDLLQSLELGGLNIQQLKFARCIAESGQFLLAMINDLLDFAAVEAGQAAIHPARIDLAGLLHSKLSAFRGQTERLGIQVVDDIEIVEPIVADGSRIRQIVEHLLWNACRHVASGGRMGVETRQVQREIVVVVWHSAPDNVGRPRRPNSDAGSLPPGASKLALAVARRLVELHRGRLWEEQWPDDRVAVCFSLPLPGRESLGSAAVALPADSRRRIVLVVEDDPTNQTLIGDTLSFSGFQVAAVTQGADVVEKALSLQPDIILLDIQLPDLNGVDVLRRLRSQPAIARIPVVAVTAFAMPGDRERFLSEGFAGYISKPIDINLFADQIAHLLDKHRRSPG